jgi:DNA invertase Pin-like site-specific DNA recombinase
MPRRAYSYSRVSDPRQAREGRDGLRRQDDYAQQLCTENGWRLDDALVFIDKGRSGFHGDNLKATAGLARFLEAIKSGRVTLGSVLIIENIDRLSRQEVDVAYDLFRSIIKAGVWIATKTPPRVYKKESNSFMDLMEPIWLMYLAHMESKKKSERISAQWQTRRKKAREAQVPHGALCPAWLSHTPSGYVVLEGPARTVRAIHQLAQQGLGLLRIVRWLNEHADEHPPFGGDARVERWKRKHPGEPVPFTARWVPEYVRMILRQRAVVGDYQPHTGRPGCEKTDGEPIPGYYPVVITEEEWLRTQAVIDGRKRTTGRPGNLETNLFTGILWDATTRQRLSCTCSSAGGGKRIYRYLATGQAAGGVRFSYDQFEYGVLRRIGQLEPKDVLPPDAARDTQEARLAEIRGRLVALDHRIADVQAQVEDPENAAAVAVLTRSLTRMLDEKKQLETEYKALQWESQTSRGETLTEAQSIIELLSKATDALRAVASKRQAFLRSHPGKEFRDEATYRRLEGELAEMRRRLKATLRWLVEEVWVVVQRFGQRKAIGHAQIYLRGGARRYAQLLPLRGPSRRRRTGLKIWQLGECDFRGGDIGDAARHAKTGAQLVG